jgi:hypothetical protein
MFGMLRNLARPFLGIGRKVFGRIGRVGRKLGNGFTVAFTGQPVGRVGKEAVIREANQSKFLNLPLFEPSGNKNLLRQSDYMVGNMFMGE